MSLTPNDIKQIAHLARLGIEEEALAADLSTMLALVEQLQAVPLKP